MSFEMISQGIKQMTDANESYGGVSNSRTNYTRP